MMEKVAHLPNITGSILEISSLMVSKALSKVLLVTRLTINISYLMGIQTIIVMQVEQGQRKRLGIVMRGSKVRVFKI